MAPRLRLLFCALLAGVVAAPAFAGLSEPPPTDVTVLLRQAAKLLHSKAQFKKAVLLEADGLPKGAKTTTAAGITKWRFVYGNYGSGSKYASVFIHVTNGHLGKPKGNVQPWLEDQAISKVPKMTLTAAVTKLRAHGFKKAFANVTLRKPLFPGVKEAYYIFGFQGNSYVSVGTQSGKVKRIS